MKLLTFIRQRSFARYIMVDVTAAACRLGWDAQWLDLEGRLHGTSRDPLEQKLRVIGETVVDIRRFNPDLVVSYGLEYLEPVFQTYVDGFDTRFHEMIRSPALFFLCDFGFPFGGPPDDVPSRYLVPLQRWNSLVLCWDREATAALRVAGVTRALHCPLAVNEQQFYAGPEVRSPTALPVLFVGGPSDDRVRTLAAVADLGLTVHGYDPDGWRQHPSLRRCYAGEVLERDSLREVYQRSLISVNVTRPHGPSSLNMRVFEAMACGSLMVTDNRGDASRLFDDGKEIVVYHDSEDLRRKVEYYLAHDTARLAIAEAGRRRVLEDHTYRTRLERIAPEVMNFHAESRLLRHLSELVSHDPTKALRFIRFLEQEGSIKNDLESLRFLEATAHDALGHVAQAETCAAEVLRRNPRHREAEAFARQIRQSA